MQCSLYLMMMMMMMMMNSLVSAGPTGLTLKLIHSDSPNSPLYPGRNLTQLEIVERAYQGTIARHQLHSNQSSSLDTVRPRVSFDGPFYMVELGIGTFPYENPPYMNYYFALDTGSDLLWLQCRPCRLCFHQDAPLFPGIVSHTYHELHTSIDNPNPFCSYDRFERDSCGYAYKYVDGTSTLGVLATEKLTVSGLDVIDNFVFGCGLEQNFPHLGKKLDRNPIAGYLGLGGGVQSFLIQLGDRGQYKFEYCLELWTHGSPSDTFLRFGSDTKIEGGGQLVQSTNMFFARTYTHYYVSMSGISVAGVRLQYQQEVFDLRNDGTGGCIFDSGTPSSIMSPEVYDPLLEYLLGYFAHSDIFTRPGPGGNKYQICFHRPNWLNINLLPKITFHFADFHFQGEAAFEIEPAAAFFIDTDMFCLKIFRQVGSSFSVTFGAFQQANHRVLYDVGRRLIAWSTEECVAYS